MVVAAVYILYLLFLIMRACSELRHMPYVGELPFTDTRGRVGQEWTSHGGRSGWSPPSKWPGLGREDRGSLHSLRLGTSTLGLEEPCRAEWVAPGHLDSALGQHWRGACAGRPAGALGAPVAWNLPGSFQNHTLQRSQPRGFSSLCQDTSPDLMGSKVNPVCHNQVVMAMALLGTVLGSAKEKQLQV